ncbi:MAG: RNA polymerase sigma factor [Planctomycetota bacterium]|nr:MAG: RNA polymerase sigma factor [Planctomycetota bacterium]
MTNQCDSFGSKTFVELMRRVRSGDEQAAQQLYERLGPYIDRIVARRLRARLLPGFDPEDFTQAAWASFFARPHLMERFTRPRSVVAFVSRMASNKLIDQWRRRRRATARAAVTSIEQNQLQYTAVLDDGRTPSEIVATDEEVERCLAGMPEVQREICRLLVCGFTQEEVAERVGVSVRTVRRVVRNVAERRRRSSDDGA